MSPTGNEQPPQELPRDGEFIETQAVEKPAEDAVKIAGLNEQDSMETRQDATTNSAMSSEHVDPADDPSLKVVRPPRPEAKKRRMGIRGWIAAAVGGVVLLGGIGANAVSDKNDAEPKNSGDKTDQMQETTTTTEVPVSPTAEVEVDGVDPNSPVTSINQSLTTPTTPEQIESDSVTTPISESNSTTPETNTQVGEISTPYYEENEKSSETYIGETSVRDTVMLADYMIGNQALTGIEPTVDRGPNGTGTFSFASPDFSISIHGKMVDGILVQDQPTSYTRGLLSIDVTFNGQTVRVKSDDLNDLPAILVEADGRKVSTDSSKFEESENDPEFASKRAGEIIRAVTDIARNKK
jgi:hypothetical protein